MNSPPNKSPQPRASSLCILSMVLQIRPINFRTQGQSPHPQTGNGSPPKNMFSKEGNPQTVSTVQTLQSQAATRGASSSSSWETGSSSASAAGAATARSLQQFPWRSKLSVLQLSTISTRTETAALSLAGSQHKVGHWHWWERLRTYHCHAPQDRHNSFRGGPNYRCYNCQQEQQALRWPRCHWFGNQDKVGHWQWRERLRTYHWHASQGHNSFRGGLNYRCYSSQQNQQGLRWRRSRWLGSQHKLGL